MAAECSAERSHAGGIHNFRATCDSRNGHAAAKRFGHGDQVWLDAEVFAGEPFPGARKARLYFVSNEENPVLAANFLQKREVLFRRKNESAFAQDGLGE